MQPRRLLPLSVLLVLLSATAAPTNGHLSAMSVEAVGMSTTTADLEALFVLHAPTPAFTLDADRLTVENHHANATVFLGNRYNVAGDPDVLHDGPGLLAGDENRPTERLWVLPLEGHAPVLTASVAGCVAMEPPDADNVTARAQVNTLEPEWSIDTSDAIAWNGCRSATATVHGDFLLVLWEWDAILRANGEYQILRTGHQDARPGTPLDGTLGTADELFVAVRSGNLTLPLVPGAHELYLRDPRVDANEWRFKGATGTLPVVGDVAGTVHVAGDLTTSVTGAGAGERMGIDVVGRPWSVEVNGKAIAVPDAPGALRPAILWVVTGVAAGLVAVMWAWRWNHVRRSRSSAPDASLVVTESEPDQAPEAAGPERDLDVERRVLRVVEASPGLTVRELQRRVRASKERTAAALDSLLARGLVARRGSEARWHLFPPWPDLDERWMREVALRQESNRLLLGVLHEEPGGMEQSRLVALCRKRWDWAPSTTKDRLRRLAVAGLAEATESVPPTKSVPRGTLSVRWIAT